MNPETAQNAAQTIEKKTTKEFTGSSWPNKQVRETILSLRFRLGVLIALLEHQSGNEAIAIRFLAGHGLAKEQLVFQLEADFAGTWTPIWSGFPCKCCVCGFKCDPSNQLDQQLYQQWDAETRALEEVSRRRILSPTIGVKEFFYWWTGPLLVAMTAYWLVGRDIEQ